MKEVHIYTDGSHIDKQHNGRLGCGGILVIFGKQVDTFGIELSKEFMKDRFGADYCSNPSAELVAIYFALGTFPVSLLLIKESTLGKYTRQVTALYSLLVCSVYSVLNQLSFCRGETRNPRNWSLVAEL